jgi:dolichyl-phosphate-mannose--protein O-mannosyl transferase
MKKPFIIAFAFAVVLLVYGIISSNWGHVYTISGVLGLACICIILFTYFDKLILGDKGSFLSNQDRRVKRSEEMKQYLMAAGVILITAVIGFILK